MMTKRDFIFYDYDNDRVLCKTKHIKIPHLGQQINLNGDERQIWKVVGLKNLSTAIKVSVTTNFGNLSLDDVPMG